MPKRNERTVSELGRRVSEALKDVDAAVASNSGMTSVWANKGLAILAVDGEAQKAEALLRKVFGAQVMRPDAPNFGNVPFRVGDAKARDTNAIEFTTWFLESAMLRYSDKLSDKFKQEALSHEHAAISAIRQHKVAVDYTNIWLLKHLNLLMLGRRTGDVSAVADGKNGLEAWLSFTCKNGITEYNSPTYFAIDVTALLGFYDYAPDAFTRNCAKAGLDFIWSDLTAHYFSARGSLSGANSRTYDSLFQEEDVRYLYWLEGFSKATSAHDDLGGIWLPAAASEYRPDGEIRSLAVVPERVIEQQFGASAGKDHYTYITRDFTIGSASAYYGPNDLQIRAEFASVKILPALYVVADGTDAPFGNAADWVRPDHPHLTHLPNAIAAAQNKGCIVALFDLAPGLTGGEFPCLATDVVFPVHVDQLLVDGKKITTSGPFELPVAHDSTLFLREGKTAMAVRYFVGDGCDGQKAATILKYDGNSMGAARFVQYAYRGPPKRLAAKAVKSGLAMRIVSCQDDQEFAAFVSSVQQWRISQTTELPLWRGTVSFGDSVLETTLNLAKKSCVWRGIDGREIKRHQFSINGNDIAADLSRRLKDLVLSSSANK